MAQDVHAVHVAPRERSSKSAMIAAFGARALADEDLPSLLMAACECAARGTEVDLAKVLLPVPATPTRLKVAAGVGWPAGVVGEFTLDAAVAASSPAARAFHSAEAVRQPVLNEHLDADWQALMHRVGIVSLLNVPICSPHVVYGVLEVDARRQSNFAAEDLDFLAALASLLGCAIERRKARDALQESTLFLNAALDLVGSSRFDFDTQSGLVELGPLARLLGFSGAEPIAYEALLALMHPEDRGLIENAVQAVCQGRDQAALQAEVRFLPSGSHEPCILALRGKPLAIRDGHVRIVGAAIDVTERRRRDAELTVARAEVAADLEAMTRLSRLGARLLASSSLAPLLEEVLDATIGIQNADFGKVQLYDPRAGKLKLVAQRGFGSGVLPDPNGEPFEGALCGRSLRQAEQIIVEDVLADARLGADREAIIAAGYRALQSTPMFDRDGKPLGLLCTYFREPGRPSERVLRLTDLYVRQAADAISIKLAAEETQRSEAELRLLADALPALVIHVDRELRFRFINQHFEVWFDEPPASYIGKTLGEASRGRFEHRAEHLEAVARGERVSYELQLTSQSKPARAIEIHYIPRRGAHGEVDGFYALAFDITARKDATHALLEANLRLETAVAGRTVELTRALTKLRAEIAERERAEDALRQSQKMDALGQLTGGVAHDFNNFLAVIRSSIDVLRLGRLNEEKQARFMNMISDTVDRASRLIGQLLAFSRQQPLRRERFDVAARINDMSDMLKTMLGGTIKLQTRLAAQPCLIEADPGDFEVALMNLAANARDAMPKGGVLTIVVEIVAPRPAGASPGGRASRDSQDGEGSRDSPPRRAIMIRVRDTGDGIERARLSRIFEPFYTTKAAGKGTGLGLPQAYGFVKQSGGEIRVDSTVGEGTTVTMSLPEAICPALPAPDVAGLR